MIQRKIFYSVIQVDGIVGIRKQDGYELKIDGEIFNAYIRDGRVYILDPKSGIALQIYDTDEVENASSEMNFELIDKAKEKLMQSETLKRWKEKRDNESYRLAVKMFKAYKRAESLREKQKEAVSAEIREERKELKSCTAT
ncbi:MAG: hypothetical protein K2N15_09450 [Lachnospiraceae bacterium]|nr:hypothetical protein [Lachnospiraceae bacterium]